MNYNYTSLTLPSSDGKHALYTELYTPRSVTAKGIVQLCHGMIDYTGRYLELADYLTSRGYIFAGHHHLGHGRTAAGDGEFGFFAEKDGYELVVKDVHVVNRYLRDTFPTLPVIVLGHSMGSFIARLYATSHPQSLRGLIIHGTGGANPLAGMGIAVAKASRALHGAKHHSRTITKLAFGSYNKRFPKSEGENAWLTRDVARVAGRAEDKYTSFTFTVQGYIDLFTMLKKSNSAQWFKDYPKTLPTLVVSGTDDPVGNYGKGPDEVYNKLMLGGCTSVSLKLFEGARHELFNETNRDEVYGYLGSWLDGVIG